MKKKNFDSFTKELLQRGPEALLPRNLDESWLNFLLEKSYAIKEDMQTVEDMKYMCAAVLLLLKSSTNSGEICLSAEELDAFILQYCTELHLEALDRYSDLTISPATLKTVFKNRKVDVTKPL